MSGYEQQADFDAASGADEQLREEVSGLTPPEDGPGWQGGRIATMDAFHRAAREYREALEAAREVDAQHEAEIAPLLAKLKAAQERAGAARKPIMDHARWLEGHLLGFAQTHRNEILKGRRHDAKSALLPSGVRVAWRKQPERYEVPDTGALLEWAKANGCARAIFPEPTQPPLPEVVWFRRSAFNEWAKAQKTLPPEVRVIPESETLSITTDADGDE